MKASIYVLSAMTWIALASQPLSAVASNSATLVIETTVDNEYGGIATADSFHSTVMALAPDRILPPLRDKKTNSVTYELEPGEYVITQNHLKGYRSLWSVDSKSAGLKILYTGRNFTIKREMFDLMTTSAQPLKTKPERFVEGSYDISPASQDSDGATTAIGFLTFGSISIACGIYGLGLLHRNENW
ncbi:unannotated protein [freshwater metagenome]|uniref:Unannotated protein n=1 Tax=freshwater metagenome TaxID=449393 RepID=A0A6J7XTE1_9ZZZZ|nr:hypothetical protein [Actinomycetota bacterium]